MNEETPAVTRVEYLIAIKRGVLSTGLQIATRALADALGEHLEEGAASQASQYVTPQLQRVAGPRDAVTGELLGPILYGFQLELTDEVGSPALIIKDVSASLRRDDEVAHVLKFHDTLVEEQNLKRAHELFTPEMRLRRAISLIYLYACNGNYYDLLRNDALATDGRLRKRMPEDVELQGQTENEFFHLLFNHYGELNARRETRQLDDLIKQLAAVARAVREQALEELHAGRDDDRRGSVLRRLPVGAVSVNRPGGFSAAARQSASSRARRALTDPPEGFPPINFCSTSKARSASRPGAWRCASCSGPAVSSRSASTRQLSRKRVRGASAKRSVTGRAATLGRERPFPCSRSHNSARDSGQPPVTSERAASPPNFPWICRRLRASGTSEVCSDGNPVWWPSTANATLQSLRSKASAAPAASG